MKVLVLGAGGLLGTTLIPAFGALGHTVVAHGRNGVGLEPGDLTQAAETLALVARTAPDVVVNLAGLTDVDRCEAEPQQAWLANVLTAENVGAACGAAGAHLVHISTDQVYDGSPPHGETQARPGNCYALTKYAGELAALRAGATVLRTNFFGASRHPTRRSLTDWLYTSLTQGQAIRVFNDVFFSPLSMATLCTMIERVARERPAGVYNLGSREGLSKADFAFAFARDLGLPGQLMTRAGVRQAVLKAWRPNDMRMDCAKIENTLGMALPRLEDEIELATKDYHARV